MKNPKFIPNTKVRVNHKYFTMRSSKILRGGPGHKRQLHLFTWKQYTCTQKAELDKYALRIGFTENIYYKDKLNYKTGCKFKVWNRIEFKLLHSADPGSTKMFTY